MLAKRMFAKKSQNICIQSARYVKKPQGRNILKFLHFEVIKHDFHFFPSTMSKSVATTSEKILF